MNVTPLSRLRRLTACLALCALAMPLHAGAPLPSDSLYRLSVPLTDSEGRHFDWRDLAGKPVLVTMFYGDCNTACPIVIKNLQQTIVALKDMPGKPSVLMVSLDPLRDSQAGLARLAHTHLLDTTVFRLAVSSDDSHTRAMAAALNIKYRALSGGEINHTTRICLLDANGRVIASSSELSIAPDPAFLAQIRAGLK